nr:uncharacterized protein LOC109169386 [Ipomoea trifida]
MLQLPKAWHYKSECPYPIVKKHQDENNYKKNSGRYHHPKSNPNDADEESNKIQKNDKRRKALAVEEKTKEKNEESCTSSSSSESDSSEDEKGLLCLFSQEDSEEETCFMAEEEEVTSQDQSSNYSSESVCHENPRETFEKMMKSFYGIEDSHLKLKEENAKLLAERQDLEDLKEVSKRGREVVQQPKEEDFPSSISSVSLAHEAARGAVGVPVDLTLDDHRRCKGENRAAASFPLRQQRRGSAATAKMADCLGGVLTSVRTVNSSPVTSLSSLSVSGDVRRSKSSRGLHVRHTPDGDGGDITRRCKATGDMAAHLLPLGRSGARQRHGLVRLLPPLGDQDGMPSSGSTQQQQLRRYGYPHAGWREVTAFQDQPLHRHLEYVGGGGCSRSRFVACRRKQGRGELLLLEDSASHNHHCYGLLGAAGENREENTAVAACCYVMKSGERGVAACTGECQGGVQLLPCLSSPKR